MYAIWGLAVLVTWKAADLFWSKAMLVWSYHHSSIRTTSTLIPSFKTYWYQGELNFTVNCPIFRVLLLPPHWLIAGQIFWSCWFFMGTLWQLGTFVPNLLSPCVWQNREIHQFQKSKWNAHSRTVWEVLKTLDISKKGTALIDISKWTYSVLSRSRPTFHQHNWKHSQSAKGCAGTLNMISEQILLIFYTLSTA